MAACRLAASTLTELLRPECWQFEGSLSQTLGFVPSAHLDRSLRFRRTEEGIDVYLNEHTGKEVYVGRTGAKLRPKSVTSPTGSPPASARAEIARERNVAAGTAG